jgi:hypothetical protein
LKFDVDWINYNEFVCLFCFVCFLIQEKHQQYLAKNPRVQMKTKGLKVTCPTVVVIPYETRGRITASSHSHRELMEYSGLKKPKNPNEQSGARGRGMPGALRRF